MSSSADSQLATIGINDPECFKDFTIYNSSLLNFRICPSDSDIAAFYVDNSEWQPNVPSITLHNGADKDAPIIGVVHLTLASTNTIGLGNPTTDPNGVVWEQLDRTSKWSHATYQFDYSLRVQEARRKFTWKRVSRIPLTGSYSLQLVEESKPDVVLAAFMTGSGMRVKTRGKLMIRMGNGELWERMVLLTALSVIELTRRRLRRRRFR
jgi:hypothetical protein